MFSPFDSYALDSYASPVNHWSRYAAWAATLGGLLAPPAAWAQTRTDSASTPILRLDEVRPGMVGEARTVFQGTAPEGFKLRVVSILRNFLPKQDIILVRAEDPRLERSGIAAGMSGSPVYVDGKLMGAIAYGWSFAKEPLAGVTPIEAMLAERGRADRPPEASALASSEPVSTGDSSGRLQPVALPLSVSGASDAALAYLEQELRGFGLHPMRAGGGGGKRTSADAAPSPVPGAALGVALTQGDLSTTAMGTLTYRDGNQVLAFGHPMLGIGAVKMPMVLGEVHAIIPSLSSSLKMASPLLEVGSITDDGKNGVVGVLGDMASKVPIEVRVTSQGKEKPPFRAEIARHRRLLPLLATMVISTALSEAIPDVTDMIADVSTRLHVRGFAPVELRDQVVSSDTLAPRVLAMSHGMRALSDVLTNPFAPAIVDKIEVVANVEFRAGSADIVALAAAQEKVRAGAEVPLRVTLRPYGGSEVVRNVSIAIPPDFAGKTVKIEAAAGAQVKAQVAHAEDLDGFIRNLRAYFPATALVVSLSTKESGASLRGRLIHDLPPSAIDTLRSASASRRADTVHMVEQVPFAGARVLVGQKDITVQVMPSAEE